MSWQALAAARRESSHGLVAVPTRSVTLPTLESVRSYSPPYGVCITVSTHLHFSFGCWTSEIKIDISSCSAVRSGRIRDGDVAKMLILLAVIYLSRMYVLRIFILCVLRTLASPGDLQTQTILFGNVA